MAIYTHNLMNPRSLSAQIKDAEQQVLNRQRGVGIGASALVRKTQQQMTTPVSLLLACGVGFLLGELTKRQSTKLSDSGVKREVAKPSPLKIALNLATSIQTLYTALPIVWIMKNFYEPRFSDQPRVKPAHSTMAASNERDIKGHPI